jgi:hypothetical protein
LPYTLSAINLKNRLPKYSVDEREKCLKEIKGYLNKKSVISMDTFTAIDWLDGYRYTNFDRGVVSSPKGIADYIIIDHLFDHLLPNRIMGHYLEKEENQEFSFYRKNIFFTVYQRYRLSPDSYKERMRFIKYFGEDAIGNFKVTSSSLMN